MAPNLAPPLARLGLPAVARCPSCAAVETQLLVPAPLALGVGQLRMLNLLPVLAAAVVSNGVEHHGGLPACGGVAAVPVPLRGWAKGVHHLHVVQVARRRFD